MLPRPSMDDPPPNRRSWVWRIASGGGRSLAIGIKGVFLAPGRIGLGRPTARGNVHHDPLAVLRQQGRDEDEKYVVEEGHDE
jgi:hypothetical protein